VVELDHKELLLEFIQKLENEEENVVLFLDEFPDVIQAIIKNDGPEKAIDTLTTLRSIRLNDKLKKFTLVFAGSIGLEHVISTLDRTKHVNDLKTIHVDPLTSPEATELIAQLTEGATMKIAEDEKIYLINKTGHLLPYYIQLMIEKCDVILRPEQRPGLTVEDIDLAYKLIIKEGRSFEDWEHRLSKYLSSEDAGYCKEILMRCAHSEVYPIVEAYDLSKRIIPNTHYKQLIDDVLLKDGYLVEEGKGYRFLSPFLKEWWANRHPKFEIED